VLDREKQMHEPPFPYHVYKLFFHCTIVGGKPAKNPESSESAFFVPSNLPELSLSRIKKEQIEWFYYKISNHDSSADFD
jgi:hypothetical protein